MAPLDLNRMYRPCLSDARAMTQHIALPKPASSS
jgi:hypothetical protein